jgi:peptide/nickel transport system substrate-binding protein
LITCFNLGLNRQRREKALISLRRYALGRGLIVGIVVLLVLIAGFAIYFVNQPQRQSSTSSTTSTTQSSVVPKYGGTLTIAFPSEESASLDPVTAVSGDFTDTALYNIFEPLVMYDQNFTLKPVLATGWKQVNSTVYTFTLRTGVRFQDGTPFNASAVVFSINRGLQDCSLLKTMCDIVRKVVANNNSAVTFYLKKDGPLANFFAELAYEPGLIVSPTAVNKFGDKFGQHPVGTGPYMLADFVPNDHLTLVANPNYWGGKPYIDQVTLRVIPDPSTTAESLLSGSVQFSPLSAQIAAQVVGRNGLTAYYTTPYKVIMAGLNVKDPVLSNPLVRQALNYAVDRTSIIDAVEGGHAVPAFSPILPYMTGSYDPSMNPYPPHGDITKAKQLLEQAGYKNGVNITVLVSDNFVNGLTIATIMQQQMEPAGIHLNIQNLPFGQFVQRIIFEHNYSMAIFDYSAGITPAYQLYDLYNPSSFFDLQSVNDTGINSLLSKLIYTTNSTETSLISKQILNIVIGQAYGLFIYYPSKIEVYSGSVHGFTPLIVANTVPIIVDNAALNIHMWIG